MSMVDKLAETSSEHPLEEIRLRVEAVCDSGNPMDMFKLVPLLGEVLGRIAIAWTLHPAAAIKAAMQIDGSEAAKNRGIMYTLPNFLKGREKLKI